jgi:hypothetical protein
MVWLCRRSSRETVARTMVTVRAGGRALRHKPGRAADRCAGRQRRWALLGLLTCLSSVGLVVTPAGWAAGQPTGPVTVLSTTPTGEGVQAVVAVPAALAGMRIPTTAWSATAYGMSFPMTTVRLAGPRLQVTVVLDQASAVLGAEQGAAAEFLHQLPSATAIGVASGRSVVGATRDSSLAAVGSLSAGEPLAAGLAAAVRSPKVGQRHVIVVFARCSSVPPNLGGLPAGISTDELDIVGLGPGCPALGRLIADRNGTMVRGIGAGDALTAAADRIADRLLGEYEISIQGSAGANVTVTVHAAGQRLSADLSVVPRLGTRGGNGSADLMRGDALVIVIAIGLALALMRIRQPMG